MTAIIWVPFTFPNEITLIFRISSTVVNMHNEALFYTLLLENMLMIYVTAC